MEDIVISKAGFKTNDNINIREEFHHAFGIINEADTTPQKIIFSLSPAKGAVA